MGRYALLVDAGYLWVTVGEAVADTSERSLLRADPQGLVGELVATCQGSAGSRELLRVYWYDAAVNRVPTSDQARFAKLDDVKVRLGRMVGGRQKGVDALLLLDLVTLAANRAVDVFFLFAGDDDLSEGVREAQSRGARVVLMAVAGRDEDTIAAAMRAEADGLIRLDPSALAQHLRLEERAARSIPVNRTPAASPARPEASGVDYVERGMNFGREWRVRTGIAEWAQVLQGRPRIPADVDSELLRVASGGIVLLESERVSLREGFWAAMDESDIPDGMNT